MRRLVEGTSKGSSRFATLKSSANCPREGSTRARFADGEALERCWRAISTPSMNIGPNPSDTSKPGTASSFSFGSLAEVGAAICALSNGPPIFGPFVKARVSGWRCFLAARGRSKRLDCRTNALDEERQRLVTRFVLRQPPLAGAHRARAWVAGRQSKTNAPDALRRFAPIMMLARLRPLGLSPEPTAK